MEIVSLNWYVNLKTPSWSPNITPLFRWDILGLPSLGFGWLGQKGNRLHCDHMLSNWVSTGQTIVLLKGVPPCVVTVHPIDERWCCAGVDWFWYKLDSLSAYITTVSIYILWLCLSHAVSPPAPLPLFHVSPLWKVVFTPLESDFVWRACVPPTLFGCWLVWSPPLI